MRTVSTWNMANRILRSWAETAPADGPSNQCDYIITFTDGQKHEGRYSLKRHDAKLRHLLERHIMRFFTFNADPNKSFFPDSAIEYKAFLEKYEIPYKLD